MRVVWCALLALLFLFIFFFSLLCLSVRELFFLLCFMCLVLVCGFVFMLCCLCCFLCLSLFCSYPPMSSEFITRPVFHKGSSAGVASANAFLFLFNASFPKTTSQTTIRSSSTTTTTQRTQNIIWALFKQPAHVGNYAADW